MSFCEFSQLCKQLFLFQLEKNHVTQLPGFPSKNIKWGPYNIFVSLRYITWLNSQKKPVKGHLEDPSLTLFLKLINLYLSFYLWFFFFLSFHLAALMLSNFRVAFKVIGSISSAEQSIFDLTNIWPREASLVQTFGK